MGAAGLGKPAATDVSDKPPIQPHADERCPGRVAGGAADLGLEPPGTDFPAHVFQLDVYLNQGFSFWTNYWYAGRYTFVGYSILYYPLAALVGIHRLLAVITVAVSAAAFTLITRRAWGPGLTVWATRFFAIVAAASVVSAAFPYGLGLALALTALVAVAHRRLVLFAILATLTVAASPLAFLFLLVVLAAAGVTRSRREVVKPAVIALCICALGVLVSRLFPDPGIYPFAPSELGAALLFAAPSAPPSPGGSRTPACCGRSSSPTASSACFPT